MSELAEANAELHPKLINAGPLSLLIAVPEQVPKLEMAVETGDK